ncbi:YheC/YheD family endospore coat-associated protein [Paenibacillus agri]|uniref:YheC/YheD family protein n=1 Tax=Paenibacillus agri TaxID=2744309 RepID=A0A850EK21_9BACL|nr:YheC/YheD family protein [Paenibacillus agri]NUU60069.1 YheC/YheD family protein [Paenibacillus agri]
MKNRPFIGILVAKRSSRKKTLALYQRYHHLNLKLYTFTSEDILWKEQRIKGLSLEKGLTKQNSFPFPHVVYNRCFSKNLLTIQRLEKAIGKNKCFNSINFFNKWELYNLLKESDLKGYIPDTFSYPDADVSELLEKYRLIYIKPTYGVKGESVYRVKVMDHGDIHISMHSLAPRYICRKNENIQEKLASVLGHHNHYMVQEGIDMFPVNHQYFDIRSLVQKNILGEWEVSAITCRVAYKDYFNTSMCERIQDATELLPRLLSSELKNKVLQSLHEASVKAAQAAENHIGSLGELSVDFVLDTHKKLWIIELNGKPQKSIYNDLKSLIAKKKVYSRPLEYAFYLSQL